VTGFPTPGFKEDLTFVGIAIDQLHGLDVFICPEFDFDASVGGTENPWTDGLMENG
jgi:hypothetical protein